MVAQDKWNQTPDLSDWIESSRLNVASGLLHHAGEPGVAEAMGSYLEHSARAIGNLGAFRLELGDEVTSTI